MSLHRWALVMSMLAGIARVLQGSGATGFVQPSLPPRLPLHANIQSSNPNWAKRGLQPPPRLWKQMMRKRRTARHFGWLLELPLVSDATVVVVEGTSAFASATEGCLGLGALSADLIGGGIECSITNKFAAGIEIPSFLLAAVEADWLAAIGANVIGRVETEALADAVVAKLESGGAASMLALSEEKQVEFACGILSRVPPEKLADLLAAILQRVLQNPGLLSQLPEASSDVVLTIFGKSPAAQEVLVILVQKVIGSVEAGVLADFVVAQLESGGAASMLALSEGMQVEFACGILSRVPPQKLADLLGAILQQVLEKNPLLLGELPAASSNVVLTIFGKSSEATEVLLILLRNAAANASPVTLGVLHKIAPEAAREAAETSLGKGLSLQADAMKSLAAKIEIPPVGEYEITMLGDSAMSALENITSRGPNATVPIGQVDPTVILGGKVLVGLVASLGVKQVFIFVGLGQLPGLWVLGLGASWAAKEIYQQNLRIVNETLISAANLTR